MNQLTPTQQQVSIELLARGTGVSVGHAQLVIDHVNALLDMGETGATIVQWLSLMPRARGHAQLQLTPRPLPGELPDPVRHAMRPPDGPRRHGNPLWLLEPDRAPKRVKRRGRPTAAVCEVCSETFEMNQHGRPAMRCPKHRRTSTRRTA